MGSKINNINRGGKMKKKELLPPRPPEKEGHKLYLVRGYYDNRPDYWRYQKIPVCHHCGQIKRLAGTSIKTIRGTIII